jgi:hypothetical protein
LVLLYSGLAFFKYDDNTFWPQFARAVGENAIPTNKQTEINQAFGLSARDFDLPIRKNTRGIDFVGSAIAYIGIPLSLWDGFLDICEWALWRNDWNAMSTEEWADAIERRAGGQRRLKRFLIDNRETARDFVKELLDAREILSNDPHLTIRDQHITHGVF